MVIAAGPAVNLLIAFVILFFLAFEASEPTERGRRVAPGTPAAAVLEPGDELVAVDGRRGELDELREQIATHECAGEQNDGCAPKRPSSWRRPRRQRGDAQRPARVRRRGRAAAARLRLRRRAGRTGVGGAPRWSVDRMWHVTSQTVSIFARIFDAEQREQISGVVGSYEVTRQAIEFDTRQALLVLALISLSLAVINLFPFLPLDGGHIFWSLVEKVRGRPVPFRVMERAWVVGFVLVLMLFAIGLSNDIGRLTGEGFDLR